LILQVGLTQVLVTFWSPLGIELVLGFSWQVSLAVGHILWHFFYGDCTPITQGKNPDGKRWANFPFLSAIDAGHCCHFRFWPFSTLVVAGSVPIGAEVDQLMV